MSNYIRPCFPWNDILILVHLVPVVLYDKQYSFDDSDAIEKASTLNAKLEYQISEYKIQT